MVSMMYCPCRSHSWRRCRRYRCRCETRSNKYPHHRQYKFDSAYSNRRTAFYCPDRSWHKLSKNRSTAFRSTETAVKTAVTSTRVARGVGGTACNLTTVTAIGGCFTVAHQTGRTRTGKATRVVATRRATHTGVGGHRGGDFDVVDEPAVMIGTAVSLKIETNSDIILPAIGADIK